MRTLVKFFQWFIVLSLLIACSKTGDFFEGEMPAPENGYETDHARKGLGLDQDRYITMKSTGLKIHYRIIGKGPINIVFIPGLTNPHTVFTKQFEYFRDKAKCIYIDLPGHGLSDAPQGIEYTMGLLADAVYDVIKKEGVHRFVGVGFSMGPVVLGQFELKHPGMMYKLINLDGGFTVWPTEDPERAAFIAWRDNYVNIILSLDRATKELAISLSMATAPNDLKEWVLYYLDYPNWLEANIWYNLTAEEVNQPIGWSMPILLIRTRPIQNMALVQLNFPDADFHIMEGSGHVVQWERADDVNALIDEFVSDRPGKKY